MAYRRCYNHYSTTLSRQISSLFLTNPQSHHPIKSLLPHLPPTQPIPTKSHFSLQTHFSFSSKTHFPQNPNEIVDEDDDVSDDEEEGDEDEEDYESEEEVEEVDGNVGKRSVNEPACLEKRSYYVEEKLKEAADIGYRVVGPIVSGERVFKRVEPAFAVVQVGSHQFKVSNEDCIYVEKLKFCEVNDKLILTKVLMAGSPTQTIIGRPILPEVTVHAVVEEHALDAKVIIFKKKRRKNYRRTKGHRQELTRLRITDIQGVEKPEVPPAEKPAKASAKKVEKVAVAA